MSRISTMCTGSSSVSISPGSTSMAQLSEATTATSLSCSHSQHARPRPGSPAMNAAASRSVTNFVRQPVRNSTMSPEPTSTPWRSAAASRSSRRDDVAALQPVDALEAGDVEQHATADDALGQLVDRAVLGAVRSDIGRREAVVQLVVVEDVGQAVPLRRRLQRHEHVVVGVVEGPGELLVGAGLRHQPHRVDAPPAGLRTVAVERDAEVEDRAALDERAGGDDPLRA